jgi:hypothetical protein
MKIKSVDEIKTKGEASQIAIYWQNWASKKNLCYYEIAEWAEYFRVLAEKFDLTEEFKENGII